MTSALKIILKERRLSQNDIAQSLFVAKQTVSKWVLSQKKIRDEDINFLADKLNVPRERFVNENRLCRQLNEDEEKDLRTFLLNQQFEYIENTTFDKTEAELEDALLYPYLLAKRESAAVIEARAVKQKLSNDVFKTQKSKYTSREQCIDDIENNTSFYKKILFLRENDRIESDEWDSILIALLHLACKKTELQPNKYHDLAYQIFPILQEYRAKKEEKRKRAIESYIECFGSLPEPDEDEDDDDE